MDENGFQEPGIDSARSALQQREEVHADHKTLVHVTEDVIVIVQEVEDSTCATRVSC